MSVGPPRVLVAHNRYRVEGGEERSVELQLRALRLAGIEHRLLERRSDDVGRPRAGVAMLTGGARPQEVAAQVAELRADVLHMHNMQPLLGPRALAAARAEGARVVLHLHNFRLFCAIGVAFRDGSPCFRCRGRRTLPGLALRCRGSVPEAAAYAAGLSLHQPTVLEAVDRFVAPSRYAVAQLIRLGLPADAIQPLPHYLPGESLAGRSRAADGEFALVAARLAPEKGVGVAIEAAAISGVPLRVAGDGPLAAQLHEQARALDAPVEFLGRVGGAEVRALLDRAAALVVPSVGSEFAPFAPLEAMAAGVPVVATRSGGVPELVGEEHCVPRGDAPALAAALSALWEDPGHRAERGEAGIERVRTRHGEERYLSELLGLYRRVRGGEAS